MKDIDFREIEKAVFAKLQSDQKRGVTQYSDIDREIITKAVKAALLVVKEYHQATSHQ